MSKLEELIEQLCPDGVKYKVFGEIANIVRGASPRPIKKFITTNADGVNWIKIGDVKPGSKYITETSEKITPEGAAKSRLVKEGDFILSNSMSFGRPYIVKSEGCIHDGWLAISDFSNTFISDFLYHLLNSNKYQMMMRQRASFGGAVQNLNADIVKGLELPIIPLPIQEEIVRILDSMTSLTAELTAELTTELKARQKQYEYYRDSLLSFDESRGNIVKLKEICEIYLGLTATPKYMESGVKFISAQNTSKDYLDLTNTKYISVDDFAKATSNAKPKRGDLLFTRVGSNIGHPVIVETDEDLCIFVSLGYLRNKDKNVVDIRYLRYWMNTEMFWEQVRKNVHGAAKINLNTGWLKEFDVYLPPLEEQQRIVDILDRFDKLFNDISEGLPAEIEARKKQYEYYRDKLLTFKEKEA